MKLARSYPAYPCTHAWTDVNPCVRWCSECGALLVDTPAMLDTRNPLNARLQPYWDRVLWSAFALNTLALIVLTAGLVWLFEAPR